MNEEDKKTIKPIKDGENKWDVGGVKILYFEKGKKVVYVLPIYQGCL